MNNNPKFDAITLVAHGSRVQNANDFVLDFANRLEHKTEINVAFLEIGTPSLNEALQMHISQNKKSIRVIPLFLAPGKHTTQDIPNTIDALLKTYPSISIHIDDFIGRHPDFFQFLTNILDQ